MQRTMLDRPAAAWLACMRQPASYMGHAWGTGNAVVAENSMSQSIITQAAHFSPDCLGNCTSPAYASANMRSLVSCGAATQATHQCRCRWAG